MTGRAEVVRLTKVLESTFDRFSLLPEDELELRADFARYLCVVVSGFSERSVRELAIDGCRRQASPSVLRHIERNLSRFQNANAEKVAQLVGSFSADWQEELEDFYRDGGKDALDSVAALKNSIAHGDQVGVTFHRIRSYFEQILAVIDHLADRFCPE